MRKQQQLYDSERNHLIFRVFTASSWILNFVGYSYFCIYLYGRHIVLFDIDITIADSSSSQASIWVSGLYISDVSKTVEEFS